MFVWLTYRILSFWANWIIWLFTYIFGSDALIIKTVVKKLSKVIIKCGTFSFCFSIFFILLTSIFMIFFAITKDYIQPPSVITSNINIFEEHDHLSGYLLLQDEFSLMSESCLSKKSPKSERISEIRANSNKIRKQICDITQDGNYTTMNLSRFDYDMDIYVKAFKSKRSKISNLNFVVTAMKFTRDSTGRTHFFQRKFSTMFTSVENKQSNFIYQLLGLSWLRQSVQNSQKYSQSYKYPMDKEYANNGLLKFQIFHKKKVINKISIIFSVKNNFLVYLGNQWFGSINILLSMTISVFVSISTLMMLWWCINKINSDDDEKGSTNFDDGDSETSDYDWLEKKEKSSQKNGAKQEQPCHQQNIVTQNETLTTEQQKNNSSRSENQAIEYLDEEIEIRETKE